MRDHARWAAEHLLVLEPGFDHFNNIKVPFHGKPDHNPDFVAQSHAQEKVRRRVEGIAGFVMGAVAFVTRPLWKRW